MALLCGLDLWMGFALCLFGGLPDECCLFGLCFVCWVAVVFCLRFPRFVFGICFGCLVISTCGFWLLVRVCCVLVVWCCGLCSVCFCCLTVLFTWVLMVWFCLFV